MKKQNLKKGAKNSMSSRKETKVLIEGWRKFLTEADYSVYEAEEPGNDLRDSASKKTHLAIFDFDKTLFNPAASPVPSMQYYWGNTVASMAGTPMSDGMSKIKELSVDHTIVILTARAVVDKERKDKTGKSYGEIFNEFMVQQSTSELTDDIFAAKIAEILGFSPDAIVRGNKGFNSAMYKKEKFPDIVNQFVGTKKGTYEIKFFENDPKTFNAVVDVPLKISDQVKINYKYYLVTESYQDPKVQKSTSEVRKGETTPEPEKE